MDFSIITPSYRNNAWLQLCVASVADQQGVTHEHIVQDAGSDDGTLDWLPKDPRVRAFIEKDAGMYDAINRGLRRANGDLLAYLNCDEQYLPGALAAVKEFFTQHPDVELVFADAVVVDADGRFVACRKVVRPFPAHVRTAHLPTLTCATFFRRRLIECRSLFFDPDWRALGDAIWVLAAQQQGVRMDILRRYTSVFTRTGQNLSFLPPALREKQKLRALAPAWQRALAPVWVARHRLEKIRRGCYRQAPFEFSLYTPASPRQRTTVTVTRPGARIPTEH